MVEASVVRVVRVAVMIAGRVVNGNLVRVGVMAVETAQGRSMREAGKIGFATWIGMAVGVALKVGLAFAMMGIFLFALWF